MRIRLNKLLATRGVAARRKCDALIASGAVRVNGEVIVAPGAHVDPDHDDVRVNGKRIAGASVHRYFVLNKPVGMISTLSDPQGRRSLRELLPPGPRVFPVGRLDADTSGLLLLTNDGDLAHHLMHPRYGVEKFYRAVVADPPNERQLQRLQRGVMFEPGVRSAPARVRERDPVARGPVIEIAISEGRYRQVRRMCEAVGLDVVALHRWGYGPLRLGDLERGMWRELSEEEVARLRSASARPKARPASLRRPRGLRRGEAPRHSTSDEIGFPALPGESGPEARAPRAESAEGERAPRPGGRPERAGRTPRGRSREERPERTPRGRNPAERPPRTGRSRRAAERTEGAPPARGPAGRGGRSPRQLADDMRRGRTPWEKSGTRTRGRSARSGDAGGPASRAGERGARLPASRRTREERPERAPRPGRASAPRPVVRPRRARVVRGSCAAPRPGRASAPRPGRAPRRARVVRPRRARVVVRAAPGSCARAAPGPSVRAAPGSCARAAPGSWRSFAPRSRRTPWRHRARPAPIGCGLRGAIAGRPVGSFEPVAGRPPHAPEGRPPRVKAR